MARDFAIGRLLQPRPELSPAGLGYRIDVARRFSRLRDGFTGDQAFLGQLLEGRVDLAVALTPEVVDRSLDDFLISYPDFGPWVSVPRTVYRVRFCLGIWAFLYLKHIYLTDRSAL